MNKEVKNKKLQSLSSEVKDFHPLLSSLLEKINGVVKVDYTHGHEEKGADFIVTRRDDVFMDNEYIGIIAKIGKIHQDFTDVTRQIDECSMERVIPGGRKKVYLSEIWIFSNDNITSNAMEKIHHQYKDKKIKFMHSDRMIDLIDTYLPNYWCECSVRVGDYLNRLRMRNEEMDKALTLVSSKRNLSIVQDIRKREEDYKEIKKRSEPIDIHKAIEKENIILLEGGMGAGKSKLIRQLIDFYASGLNYNTHKIIPVYVAYKQLVEEYDLDIERFIEAQIGVEILLELPQDNKLLILIDGVDEKDISVEQHLENLQKLVDTVTAKKKYKALITTRPIILEKKSAVLNISVYEINPLTIANIVKFLKELCKEINLSNRIFEDLKNSILMKELPRTPISAILLANLINENSRDIPSNMTELYKKYMELMLGRWDMDKGLQSQKEYEAADNILMELSEFFINYNLSSISIPDAKELLIKYLKERNIGIEPEQLFEKIINRSGILALNAEQNVVFFKHKTFAEFLYAKKCYVSHPLVFDSRIYNFFWQNIFYFYLGLKKDCPEELEAILNLVPEDEMQRWFRLVSLGHYMLAAYMSPYDIVEKNLYKIFVEAATLLVDLKKGSIKLPFKNLTEIQVLFILTLIVKGSYSYDFFKRAVDGTTILIDTEIKDPEIKAYALFILAVVSLGIGIDDPFRYILDKYKGEIPLSIKFGILYETQNKQQQTDIVKRFSKRFGVSLKTSHFLREQAKVVHKKALSAEINTKKS